ncbi:MAG: phosphohistidine phosphatase SixA [bacterium]
MHLYLLRHGDPISDSKLHDSERPLSALGTLQANTAGQFIQLARYPIQLIIASPLLRAQQTANVVRKVLNLADILTSEYLVPCSDQQQLFVLLNERSEEHILVTGHEPHLSSTIALLIDEQIHANLEMKKCSFACVEIPRPIGKGKGVLRWLVTVEQMGLSQRQ